MFSQLLRPHAIARLAVAAIGLAATLAHAAIPPQQRQYLLDFYTATNGAVWTNNTNWNGPPGTECTWFGISCDAGQNTVIRLNLPNNRLLGTSPPNWSVLPDLNVIGLSENSLSGSVPAIASLTALTIFDVEKNGLSGALPSPANLSVLARYYANNNQFSGPIPALPGLPALQDFRVHDNQLTGAVPALNNAPLLETLAFHNNSLTGSLPALPSGLRQLVARNNQLSGALPAAPASLIAGLSSLCPGNSFTQTPSAAWDTATGNSPWYTGCAAVLAPAGGTAAIPTLSEWALILMSLLAAAMGLRALRRADA